MQHANRNSGWIFCCFRAVPASLLSPRGVPSLPSLLPFCITHHRHTTLTVWILAVKLSSELHTFKNYCQSSLSWLWEHSPHFYSLSSTSSEDLHSLKFGDESAKKIRVASPMSSCFCSALRTLHPPRRENDLLEKHASDLFTLPLQVSSGSKSPPRISQSRPYPSPQPSLPVSLLRLTQDHNEDHATTISFSLYAPAWLLPILGKAFPQCFPSSLCSEVTASQRNSLRALIAVFILILSYPALENKYSSLPFQGEFIVSHRNHFRQDCLLQFCILIQRTMPSREQTLSKYLWKLLKVGKQQVLSKHASLGEWGSPWALTECGGQAQSISRFHHVTPWISAVWGNSWAHRLQTQLDLSC